jgi:hypothetical protein
VPSWLLGAGGALAAMALVAAAVRLLRRRAIPLLPVRRPVPTATQDELRALVEGARRLDAVDLVRRRYRLDDETAGALVDDVAAHTDYPGDWAALARALDDDLRGEVRRLVEQGRRSSAVHLLRHRLQLPFPDADALVDAITQLPGTDGA